MNPISHAKLKLPGTVLGPYCWPSSLRRRDSILVPWHHRSPPWTQSPQPGRLVLMALIALLRWSPCYVPTSWSPRSHCCAPTSWSSRRTAAVTALLPWSPCLRPHVVIFLLRLLTSWSSRRTAAVTALPPGRASPRNLAAPAALPWDLHALDASPWDLDALADHALAMPTLFTKFFRHQLSLFQSLRICLVVLIVVMPLSQPSST